MARIYEDIGDICEVCKTCQMAIFGDKKREMMVIEDFDQTV